MLLAVAAALARAGTVVFDPSGVGVAEVELPEVPGLYRRSDPDRSWGSPLLVETLHEVAKALAFRIPEADPLYVGDLSVRGGGRLSPHVTHDLGIDADIALFTGRGTQPPYFRDVPPEDLDVRSTWALIEQLLDTGHVAFILLDQAHIDRLRAYLLDELALAADRVESLFPSAGSQVRGRRGIVRHAPHHRSHIHVRVVAAPPS